ncbi:MAG: hypothetical protein EOO09_11975 [Chitinophagaceae bacterium]|nr:MAG: hypothetical protein EOO09_11975 [Chitinophagaceae bacterium]
MRIFIFVLLLVVLRVEGQQAAGFRTSISSGLALGESRPQPVVQLGVGYQFRRLYTGVGGGYDGYRFASWPVYAEARYYPSESTGFYGYGHAGYSIANRHHRESTGWGSGEKWRNGGFYSDLGIGYRFPAGKRQTFSFALGYSVKNVKSTEIYNCTGCENDPGNTWIDKHRLSRILVKMIYEFNW